MLDDAAAGGGGPDAAARLARAVGAAARMVLLDALGDAASEVNLALSDRGRDLGVLVSVDLRLRGRSPEFVVQLNPTATSSPPQAPGSPHPRRPGRPPAGPTWPCWWTTAPSPGSPCGWPIC